MPHPLDSRRRMTTACAAAALTGSFSWLATPAHAGPGVQSERTPAARRSPSSARTVARWTDQRYGPHTRQVLDVDLSQVQGSPIVVFVHGGAWSVGSKNSGRGMAQTFTNAGFAFAAINYRLHPEVGPAEQAQDLAMALAFLRQRPGAWGLDAHRLALIGHSAGAHLAALAALDERYFLRADVPRASLKAVVLLDGAGYDVVRQMAEGENPRLYRTVFGDGIEAQRTLSPISYADQVGSTAFQIHHVARRRSSGEQSQALAARLRRAGGTAEVEAAEGESHMTIQKGFGESGDVTTHKTLAFLKRHLV